MDSTQIIEKLGGVAETARLCDVSMSAVSQWKENGIPKTQLKFLKLAKPEVFAKPKSSK
jgi:hypothetical protein